MQANLSAPRRSTQENCMNVTTRGLAVPMELLTANNQKYNGKKHKPACLGMLCQCDCFIAIFKSRAQWPDHCSNPTYCILAGPHVIAGGNVS